MLYNVDTKFGLFYGQVLFKWGEEAYSMMFLIVHHLKTFMNELQLKFKLILWLRTMHKSSSLLSAFGTSTMWP